MRGASRTEQPLFTPNLIHCQVITSINDTPLGPQRQHACLSGKHGANSFSPKRGHANTRPERTIAQIWSPICGVDAMQVFCCTSLIHPNLLESRPPHDSVFGLGCVSRTAQKQAELVPGVNPTGRRAWFGLQLSSISRAAIPAKRLRSPSARQIGPSPSHTCVGVHVNVVPAANDWSEDERKHHCRLLSSTWLWGQFLKA